MDRLRCGRVDGRQTNQPADQQTSGDGRTTNDPTTNRDRANTDNQPANGGRTTDEPKQPREATRRKAGKQPPPNDQTDQPKHSPRGKPRHQHQPTTNDDGGQQVPTYLRRGEMCSVFVVRNDYRAGLGRIRDGGPINLRNTLKRKQTQTKTSKAQKKAETA